MQWTIAMVLIILWVLGLVSSYTMGGLIQPGSDVCGWVLYSSSGNP